MEILGQKMADLGSHCQKKLLCPYSFCPSYHENDYPYWEMSDQKSCLAPKPWWFLSLWFDDFKIILQDFTFFIWNTGKFNQSFSQSGCLTRSDQKVREIQIPVIDTFKTGPMPNEPNYITNCQNGDSFCNGQWHDLVAFLLGQFWLWGMTQRFSVAFPTKVGTGRHVLWTYMHILWSYVSETERPVRIPYSHSRDSTLHIRTYFC